MEIIRADVAVLGAGLAGLAAAEGVLRHGEKPVIIEKEEYVGGMCASIRKDGYVFDFGGHRFLPHHKETADFVRSLFSNHEFVLRPRKSQIYLNGKYLQYPPEALDILKKLGVLTSIHCAAQGLYARMRHSFSNTPEASLKDWLLNRFGQRLYDIYFGPYSEKLWGVDPARISSDWAPQRISVEGMAAVIKNLFLKKSDSIKTYTTKFLYPVGGIGKIAENMLKKEEREGARFFPGRRVLKIERIDKGFEIETVNNRGRRDIFRASKVITTIPLPELVRVLHPHPPKEVQDAAASLKFRSVRFLNIMLDTRDVTPNTWLYIPEDRYIFFRIQELVKWCPKNAPSGKNGLTLELACQKGDDIWDMPQQELLDICLRDLKSIGIKVKDKVLSHFSLFSEHAYPFYSLDYKRHLRKIYRYMESIDNVITCGRQGLFRYINMDHAIESGFQAAKALNANLGYSPSS